ncbi:MAG: response regulator [Patescibacteria group bacterium]|nr:response regulator [Patescibacteria group bacterium]
MNKTKIVLIEDDKILAKILRAVFSKAGFGVAQEENGELGLAVVRKEMPALVLLDLMLPGKDGFWVLEEMAEKEEFKKIPVIVLTNLGQKADYEKAMKLGAREYIVKSQHTVAEIVDKIKNFFAKEGCLEQKQPEAGNKSK